MNVNLPYHEIPDYPPEYNVGTVLSRFIDGLGFRYFWATEGLTVEDFQYRPSEGARSLGETVDHIYDTACMINGAFIRERFNVNEVKPSGLPADKLRRRTLALLKDMSDWLKQKDDANWDQVSLGFQIGDSKPDFPFWHACNGLVLDFAQHVGQIVSFRRTLGKPINPEAHVFFGKLMKQAA